MFKKNQCLLQKKKKTLDAQLKFLFVYFLHIFVSRRGIINGLNNSWSHYGETV